MSASLKRVASLKHDLALRNLQRALGAKRQAMLALEEAEEELRDGQAQIRKTATRRLRQGRTGEYDRAWRWAVQLQKRLADGEEGRLHLAQDMDRRHREWRQACFALGRAQVMERLAQK